MNTRPLLLATCFALALGVFAHRGLASTEIDADRVHSVQDVDHRPEVVKVRPPEYPAALAGTGQAGLVAITVVVDETGELESIEVTKASAPEFGEAALECVRQWKFAPATAGGRAVRARMTLPVRFQPDVTTVATN